MTKTNGQFEKRPRDFYVTPEKALLPLLPHLPKGLSFCEPCAGNGELVNMLEEHLEASCFLPLDIEPQVDWVVKGDAGVLNEEQLLFCEWIITNPPFTWSVLAPLMKLWISLRPTALLLPADFMHNKRFAPFLNDCTDIISIGRVKWIEESKATGVENYCWYIFNKNNKEATKFYGRDY